MGPVHFNPLVPRPFHALLYVRNNLTQLSTVRLSGEGGEGRLEITPGPPPTRDRSARPAYSMRPEHTYTSMGSHGSGSGSGRTFSPACSVSSSGEKTCSHDHPSPTIISPISQQQDSHEHSIGDDDLFKCASSSQTNERPLLTTLDDSIGSSEAFELMAGLKLPDKAQYFGAAFHMHLNTEELNIDVEENGAFSIDMGREL